MINSIRSQTLYVLFAFALTSILGSQDAYSTEPDLQLWVPVQFIHPVGEKWAVSMQAETRLKEDISEFSQLVLKPAINHHFNDTFALSVGYKWIDKFEQANESDFWQEFHINRKFNDLVTGFQIRLEERFIEERDGVLPRVRFLEHMSHPIGEGPNYLTGSLALRFNLGGNGSGPVNGFEQSRVYAALGRHLGKRTLFEVGYLYRYEIERVGSDLNDHALHFQLVVNTRAKKIKKPYHRDWYR
jgi:hypothetical protein